MFPIEHARRLAGEFPRARLVEVPHASTYVMLDDPGVVAAAILATNAQR